MNEFLDDRYAEGIDRLVLGIEPRDVKRDLRIAQPIEIAVEGPALTDAMKRSLLDEGRVLTDTMRRVDRHSSCRHVLVYEKPPKPSITLRFIDRYQRFVPRRLKVGLVAMAHPETPAELDVDDGVLITPPVAPAVEPTVRLAGTLRTRRPGLFPGAAYDLSEQSTGLRGRVVRADVADPRVLHPARWARIEATRDGAPAGTAHADHQGEFLLLLDADTVREGNLVADLVVTVTAKAPRIAPVPPSALEAAVDPLWDLPIEELAAPGTWPDGVADGTTTPAGYDGVATQDVHFRYGVLRSLGVAPFQIT